MDIAEKDNNSNLIRESINTKLLNIINHKLNCDLYFYYIILICFTQRNNVPFTKGTELSIPLLRQDIVEKLQCNFSQIQIKLMHKINTNKNITYTL